MLRRRREPHAGETRGPPRHMRRRRREPQALRVGALPSDLPEASSARRGGCTSKRLASMRCAKRSADSASRIRRHESQHPDAASERAAMNATRAVARRRRAPSPSTRASQTSTTAPRMRPTGPRGGASTPTSRSRTEATASKASAPMALLGWALGADRGGRDRWRADIASRRTKLALTRTRRRRWSSRGRWPCRRGGGRSRRGRRGLRSRRRSRRCRRARRRGAWRRLGCTSPSPPTS